jgi:hypothetical protein
MTEQMDGEERANLHQRIGALEIENEQMRRHRSDDGLNAISLQVARKIEDIFAEGHAGGRSQRLARVQIAVRETVRVALQGSEYWRASSDARNAHEPEEGAFERSDYTMLETFLRTAIANGDDKAFRALMSNNFNIILAALAIAGLPDDAPLVTPKQ